MTDKPTENQRRFIGKDMLPYQRELMDKAAKGAASRMPPRSPAKHRASPKP